MLLFFCNSEILRAALLATLLLACTNTAAESTSNSAPLIEWSSAEQVHSTPPHPQLHQDESIRIAAFNAPQHETQTNPPEPRPLKPAESRQLAPQSPLASNLGDSGSGRRSPEALPFSVPQLESLSTAGAGLAVVVGLFLVCMWLLRRSGPTPTSPLPKEAVAVLGRIPLAARNYAQLLQVGNKLVLVAVTAEGVAPITEVTDPAEVQRLLGLCMRNHKHSTTAEFQHVLQQLANEPAKGFLGNEAHEMTAGLRR